MVKPLINLEKTICTILKHLDSDSKNMNYAFRSYNDLENHFDGGHYVEYHHDDEYAYGELTTNTYDPYILFLDA